MCPMLVQIRGWLLLYTFCYVVLPVAWGGGCLGGTKFWHELAPILIHFWKEVADSGSWRVWGSGSVLGIFCAKFGHSFPPIIFPVFPTSVFYGSVWSAVMGVWTFHVGFKFGNGLAPISTVLFWSGRVMESCTIWGLVMTREVVLPCWSKLGNVPPPIFFVVCCQGWCFGILGVSGGMGRGVFRWAQCFHVLAPIFLKFWR